MPGWPCGSLGRGASFHRGVLGPVWSCDALGWWASGHRGVLGSGWSCGAPGRGFLVTVMSWGLVGPLVPWARGLPVIQLFQALVWPTVTWVVGTPVSIVFPGFVSPLLPLGVGGGSGGLAGIVGRWVGGLWSGPGLGILSRSGGLRESPGCAPPSCASHWAWCWAVARCCGSWGGSPQWGGCSACYASRPPVPNRRSGMWG